MNNCSWKDIILKRVYIKVPELKENQDLAQELIESAFSAIMIHSQAISYKKDWDNTLVNCVSILYNYLGVEGSTHRSANGIVDEYESSHILSPILSRDIPHYIKPSGYVFPSSRFDMPKD